MKTFKKFLEESLYKSSDYGAWINSKTKKIFNISSDFSRMKGNSVLYAHLDFIPKVAPKEWKKFKAGIVKKHYKKIDKIPSDSDVTLGWQQESYKIMYKVGWIRVVWPPALREGGYMGLDGRKKDIKKLASLLFPIAVKSKSTLYIDTIEPEMHSDYDTRDMEGRLKFRKDFG